MEYDSHQRDFLGALPAVHWDRCVFVLFANCKDNLTALCKHAAGTERTVPVSCSGESNHDVNSQMQNKLLNKLTNSSKIFHNHSSQAKLTPLS